MKTVCEVLAYAGWFLKVLFVGLECAGLPALPAGEQCAMFVVGLLVGGVIVLATSAIVTEILWEAIRGIMNLPENWHGAPSWKEDEQ